MDPWRPKAPNTLEYGFQFWNQLFKQTENKKIERVSKNQCKQIATFEAKRGPKRRSKLIGKSIRFLNSARRSVSYFSKTMVREGSGLQKSMQINEKRMRAQGPEKVCGI